MGTSAINKLHPGLMPPCDRIASTLHASLNASRPFVEGHVAIL